MRLVIKNKKEFNFKGGIIACTQRAGILVGRKKVVCCFVCFVVATLSDFGLLFLNPFLKGKILRSSERGVNSILTTILQF